MCDDTGMSEEVIAALPSGEEAPTIRSAGLTRTHGLTKSYGSEATRAMREQARRRREAEAKLQQHLLHSIREKPVD